MNIIRENKDLACFYTTKHSWRGKYKRVFSVGTHAITTYNPNTLEVTNQWPYGDICSISPVGKGQGTEFNLTFRKGSGKKSETLKFSTEHRTELLTEALRFRTDFSEGKITGRRYNCYKHHWSDIRKPVILEVTPGGFDQINPATNRVLCSYDYRNIEGFVDLSDYQGGFCILYGGFSRLHLFASEQREEIIKSAIDHAGNYIGISLRIRKEPLEFEQYLNLRFGKYSTDESITSLAEFVVQKISPRHSEPIKRILALTETCLVERDPATYNIATLKPLGEVFALVCDSENPQLFTIEFIKGQIRKYSSTERDSLLASLLDGVRASGNRDVCVKMTSTHKGQRWGLLSMPIDEEVESLHLRFLATPPNGNFADAVFRFNANISYSGVLHAVTQDGLFSENKEKLINNAITALLSQEGDVVASNAELESQFQAVRRLVASKAGFLAFTQLPKFRERLGVKVVKALKRSNNGVIHAAVDMLCALMCKNVKDLMDSNGIRILVDLLTLAHLHVNRATVPLQSNVIEAAPDMKRESEKEWYFGNADKERSGPYGFHEMQELWTKGMLNAKTRCWAQGMDGWRPLQAIPQLKWCLLASGQAVLNETDLATLILNMLITMCGYFPSRDQDNAIIRPLPRVKRLLSDNACLPHIIQLLLTFDPILVEKVAVLLYRIMQDNPQLPRLYLSGVFFFIMMYTGSNVLPVARFLKYTHTKQAFKSEETKGQDIFQRSILGHILPEAMVCYLENYEAEKFAEIFLGEFDTPEAIWSSEMRRLMIEKIAAHLADFTPRLQSNTRALYQYCPIPVINYPQLENELFCNIYYLKQLCDTIRFPDWPIKDPVKLLKDTLDAWKKEVEKKPPTMSIDDAYEVLNLPQGQGPHDESKIRKAYFRLAQKYHPDKNPEGRDMFEKVNKAYEFLCTKSAKITDGPDPENIILILKTQSILFNRHKEDLQPYKYAGYPMLIRTITMETSDDLLFSKESPLLPAAAELAFHTVNCSALNAEELRRENGIEVLQEAFSRCVAVLNHSSKPSDMSVQVCGHISKCYSVAAQFEECREKITEMPGIIRDLCRVLYFGKSIPRVAALGVECVSSFAVDFWLQTHLLQAGILWHLLGYLFNYDYTLEESGIQKSEETNQQEVANSLAKLSVRALSRLGGYLPEEQATPENPTIRKSVAGMLTPYVARKLAVVSATEILKMLNSNTENPYLIWNNSTRAELLEFLESQQENMIKKGDCDKTYGSEFVYSDHAKELIVGEIFVRVYNEVPTFPLEVPKAFAASLLDYIGSQAQYLHTFMAITHSAKVESEQHGDRLPRVEMALEALRNVIKYNPGSESECIGHFKLIFSLLRVHGAGQVQQLALEVVNIVTSNQDCVNNIAESMVLSNLLALLHSLPSSRQLVLETLYALTSSTKIIKEAMAKGALIYLLDMFCNSTHPQVRAQTAELFAKMTADKLIGPKVRITLMKFLPSVFMDAMRDNPEAAVHIFEGTHENPELIWNDSSRDKVSMTVREMVLEHFKNQQDNPDVNWKLPEDFAVVFAEAEGELAVGGVFLRIFIAQPAWVLRKPREFLIALLEKLTELLEKNNPHGETLETLTMATVCLFNAQPQLADQVPPLGHLPKVIQAMNHRNNAIPKSAIRVIHALSENELCVRAMASLETIGPLINGMKKRPDTVGLACEAINRMFQKEQSELVAQALKADLVPYLLKLLEGIGLENLDSPAATKAQIVKALKAMTRSLQHGEQVNEILSRSSVWSAFKDQKHDLFISESQTAGYLTGPGVAGYLTAGTSSSVMSNLPPPVDHEAGDLGYQT
ncbi:dnaJ homolog subfamily C member 13 isoform X4 [Globicephala melas]|uniref:dnaJ homolog subfamily C member 13 isoform X4 n=1 Tax=Globicephala melas TaxID=9731 RepID=UPI00293D89DC|nr:dnaJ homolog subfamily C member 13 isoform X4 [Globicephala melas]